MPASELVKEALADNLKADGLLMPFASWAFYKVGREPERKRDERKRR